jgi:hypothetical protein
MAAPGDTFRAEAYGLDAAKWIRAHKALATKQARGQRVADVTIRRAAIEAELAATSAAHFANLVLDAAATPNSATGAQEQPMLTTYVTKSIEAVLADFPQGTPAREAADRLQAERLAQPLEPGTRLATKGYTVVASALRDDGRVQVLTTTGDHFLVVLVDGPEMLRGQAFLFASYQDTHYPARAYLAAMTCMADRAVRCLALLAPSKA